MSPQRIALTTLTALALAAAGCGSGSGDGGGGGDGGSSSDPKQIFANTCGGCHTLKAAGTEGQVGPNLDELKPDAARVKKAIAEGPSVMPANLVTGAKADAVAKFVADNAGR
jgi:mono/diheme cytochrome c family protein